MTLETRLALMDARHGLRVALRMALLAEPRIDTYVVGLYAKSICSLTRIIDPEDFPTCP